MHFRTLTAGGVLVVADMICHVPLAEMSWGQWLSLRLVAAGAGIPSANLLDFVPKFFSIYI